jgi:hypothetical protein
VQKTHRLFIVALFGAIMFVTRVFVPQPISKMLIVVDAVLLALSALFVKGIGATYASVLGGVLASLWMPALLPFSFILMVAYGVMVDLFVYLFRITAKPDGVNRNRLMAAMAVSTLLIGFVSYYASTLLPILSASLMMDLVVAFIGPATGVTAGYAAAYLWNKYLKNIPV